jgi:DNA uptake protein ComE-like DNA-binding protein
MTAINANARSGFILPTVIWTITALALVAAVTTEWVSHAVDQAYTRSVRAEAERRIAESESNVLYLLTSEPLSGRGIEIFDQQRKLARKFDPTGRMPLGLDYVALDDRPYVRDDVTIRLQDARGLININNAPDEDIVQLLAYYDVPFTERGALIAKLRDYISEGDLARPNGAKRQAYASAGLPPPTYAPLITPSQAQRIMGWNDRLEIWDVYSGIQTLTATGELSALNLFTAPRTILLTVPGINARTADAIIAAREQQLINSTPELAKLTNAPINLDPFKYILFPSNELRLRLAMRGDRYERVIDLKLTGTELDSPYRINYSYLTPINRSAVQDRAPIPLPKPILTPLPDSADLGSGLTGLPRF